VVLRLNIPASGTQPVRQLNPQILNATLLVDAVRRDIESLLPQALREGAVSVSETKIRQWQTALQAAISVLNSVPAPLIFPPPAFVTLIHQAVNQINEALTTLGSIPIATPAIFPPQPGQASISLETLQFLLDDLRQAEMFLIEALLVA
jgi:hypothetical protein